MARRDQAICLRTTDYSETSQVVRVLTRGAGVVRLLAKGSKRPKSKSAGALDMFSEGDLVFTHPSHEALGTLMEFTETVSRPALRKDAGRLNAAMYMIELVGSMLGECDPHPEVFDLVHSGLDRLARSGSSVAAVLAYFQLRLLRHVGLMGQLDSCVACKAALSGRGKASEVSFSSAMGGLLCGACQAAAAEKIRLDRPTLEALAALKAAESGKHVRLPEPQARAVNRLLAYHITHQLGKRPRMTRYVID